MVEKQGKKNVIEPKCGKRKKNTTGTRRNKGRGYPKLMTLAEGGEKQEILGLGGEDCNGMDAITETPRAGG